jgi:formylglycine-generating enzyme required for sulfatase activity
MKSFYLLVAAGALLMTVASCSKKDVQVSEVTLNETALVLVIGDSKTLEATVAPADADNRTVIWESSNTDVASVDASTGEVTAVATGEATITAAAANGKTATCEVRVYLVETVLIPKGTFLMGSSDGSAVGSGTPGTDPNATPEEPGRQTCETQHSVTLTKDYYMSRYEITNAQYAAFLNDMEIDNTGAKDGVQGGETLVGPFECGVRYSNGRWEPVDDYANYPAVEISWYGAKAYAEWAGGDLPTEAQWERAARGDVKNMPFGIGTGKVLTEDMATFWAYNSYDFDNGGEYSPKDVSSAGIMTAVGSYSANAYGLYDMHGNVFEWCLDQWDGRDNYADLPTTDPVCTTGQTRVLRSGGSDYHASQCRSASRHGITPDEHYNHTGFRVVFVP